ncbi:MAG: HD domain-containing phosphohydrolase, partial [Chloroflexota bacterium]
TSIGIQAGMAMESLRAAERERRMLLSAVRALVAISEMRDPQTRGHSERVCTYAAAIANELKLPPREAQAVQLSALLHDIGKIITDEKSTVGARGSPDLGVETHIVNGERILRQIEGMDEVLPGVTYHHARCDGSGYPAGVVGADIPLVGKIVAVANAFDNLCVRGDGAGKPYSVKEALVRLGRNTEGHWDEKVTDAFALVLHSHLPYARGAGRWPHGEEWVHEAILGTYLPILGLLHDLRDSGVPYRVTIGLTPTLLEQLADADIDHRFIEYCDDQIHRATQDVQRFGGNGDTERGALAMFYLSLFRAHREAYALRFGRDLVGAFADLARTGHVEILTSAATHGYLPLLDPASVHAQLAVGTRTTRRRTGIEPRGIWLPECAYAPGLEDILEAHGITHFFTDPALFGARRLVEGGHRFETRRSGDAIGVPLVDGDAVDVLRPYLVHGSAVAALARHDGVSGQVWSAMMGYPGDGSYREFHRKDERSGLRYWRVTDVRLGLSGKGTYSPGAASERVRSHAEHFVQLVRDTLAERSDPTRSALLTVTYDAELFGHWWFEGIDWLGPVLR